MCSDCLDFVAGFLECESVIPLFSEYFPNMQVLLNRIYLLLLSGNFFSLRLVKTQNEVFQVNPDDNYHRLLKKCSGIKKHS